MYKPVQKILAILIVIVLLPAVVFSVFEINSLNENEIAIDSLYNNQLKLMLNSINKHTIDVVEGWSQRINLLVAAAPVAEKLKNNQSLRQFLNINTNISSIFTGRLSSAPEIFVYLPGEQLSNNNLDTVILKVIKSNELKIKRLLISGENDLSFSNFLESTLNDTSDVVIFPINYTSDKTDFCGLIINPATFIEKILKPEFQAASQKKFIISIINNRSGEEIYSSGTNGLAKVRQKQALTLLPRYSIGMVLKGQTISSIVKQRTNRTLLLIVLVDVLLLIGLWYAIRNIKREMELTRLKTNFIANVSHELRTPLSLISLFAETLVLERVVTSEKQKEYHKMIFDETGRLSRIVNKILSFYQIESNKRAYNFKPTDINSIASKIFDTYSYQLENAGFTYSLKLCEDIPKINGDEESLTEAVINLLDNSIKYSKEKKVIEIETGVEDDFIFIKVIDCGIGIPAQSLNKIFDKFYRIQSGLVHETKGAGLGLSIVKSIIDAHKGIIKVYNNKGGGSCFELKFRKSVHNRLEKENT